MFRRKIINKHGGIILNKGVTKLVAGGLVLVTIGGSCYYLGNSTQPPTYVKTEIIQTNEDEVKINYKDIILEELHAEAQLIICSNKMIIPMTFEENHWYGSVKKDIEFSAIGKWTIDFSKITSDNIVMNENSKSITIFLSKPTKSVELLEDETKFEKTENKWFCFGDIEYTAEEYESVKHNIKCEALANMIDLDEQVKNCARESIHKIITTVTRTDYDIRIIYIE